MEQRIGSFCVSVLVLGWCCLVGWRHSIAAHWGEWEGVDPKVEDQRECWVWGGSLDYLPVLPGRQMISSQLIGFRIQQHQPCTAQFHRFAMSRQCQAYHTGLPWFVPWLPLTVYQCHEQVQVATLVAMSIQFHWVIITVSNILAFCFGIGVGLALLSWSWLLTLWRLESRTVPKGALTHKSW